MSAGEVSLNEEQLAKDAREFGLQIATAVLSEVEGEGHEERLQAMRSVFIQAIDHIEKRYGSEKAAMWQDEANRVIQERFAALGPPQAQGPEGHLQDRLGAEASGEAGRGGVRGVVIRAGVRFWQRLT